VADFVENSVTCQFFIVQYFCSLKPLWNYSFRSNKSTVNNITLPVLVYTPRVWEWGSPVRERVFCT
jgi:hypothetical protein